MRTPTCSAGPRAVWPRRSRAAARGDLCDRPGCSCPKSGNKSEAQGRNGRTGRPGQTVAGRRHPRRPPRDRARSKQGALLRHNLLPPPASSPGRSGHRPVGPKSMSATWCSSKTGNPKPAGTRQWSSRSLATTSSNSGSGIIPKKEPWSAAAISWRCCRQPDRQCPSAHEPPRSRQRPGARSRRAIRPLFPIPHSIPCNRQFEQFGVLGGGG
jgi:hypothetical protein